MQPLNDQFENLPLDDIMTEARQDHRRQFTANESATTVEFSVIVVVVVDDGAGTVVPVVVEVLDLEILHQGPVVVSVAFRQ